MPHFRYSLTFHRYWRLSLLITIYLLVLLLNGLDEFLRSGFDVNFMFTPEWWYRVFRVLFSNILIFIGTFMYLLDLAVRTYEEIAEKRKQVEIAVEKHIDPVTFDPFHIAFERKRKIKYYKKVMQNRLEKLERKAKLKSLKLWQEYHNEEKPTPSLRRAFLRDKYCRKKITILEQLSPEFIEEKIDLMRLNYRPNSKSFITNGYNKVSNLYDEYAVETRTAKLASDLIPKFLIMAGFLIAGESIIVEFQMADSWTAALFGMALKIVPLFIQIYMAFSYRDVYIDEKIMVDFRKRLDIITLYLASLKKKGVESNGV